MDLAKRTARVLAIEDDEDIRRLLRTILECEEYRVAEAATGRDGLRAFHQTRPDVVILDMALPDLDGWEVLERIRDMSEAPVLVLTARSAEADKVRALHAGADDYLTKPFSHVELLARLTAIRRRAQHTEVSTGFDDGRVRIDYAAQRAFLEGDALPLTPIEYRLLSALVRHSGQILSADQLVELAWGEAGSPGPARVKYAVLRLRRKLGWVDDGSPLQTVRGFGYRYEPAS
ncbi:MAG: response regulator transcription factor [Acidimicrobiales bacterium]